MNELWKHIEALSRHEKLALIRDITISLEEEDVSPQDADELVRRLALADANPLEGDSWAAVRERIEVGASASREMERVAA